jgi:hypothetical protein
VHHWRADEDGDEKKSPPNETEGEEQRGEGSKSPYNPQVVGGHLIVKECQRNINTNLLYNVQDKIAHCRIIGSQICSIFAE